MKRNCSLDEISDGKLYGIDDLVEANCNGCKGAAACCHRMGKSIILDPFDIYRLNVNLNLTFEKLLADKIELNVVDGIILPNLKMTGLYESCAFLNKEGKCSIHVNRPGICRIFPLGRFYENHGFKYFLQINECNHNSKTMKKVSKWIDTPDYKRNEQFIIDWHYFLNDIEEIIKNIQDENQIKNINMFLLNTFYIKEYDTVADFYTQFNERLAGIRKVIG
ncbi:YkgJ family cysteine cluster protein [Anaerocolumna sp. MB42-C2]|uniref:YkgJ family cysteine cluster protein n=1 Tax=Anaerocolumna sp. MB42-C2 TaxID=3070997 RepID=UPI0027E13ADE|nr:YkgJ family cysteine cluster protein [Anaerocolumna sp. MB42-C2]WMJ90321.1 YkgJ family cysteine cluster protein [Anaerocolumna sp. MB42-C2]